MKKNDNLKLDRQLCFSIYTATNRISGLYRELLSELNLTYPQYLVLLVLWEKNGITLKQLTDRLNLDSGTLSPVIKRLQKNQFLTKQRSTVDERNIHLYLTQRAMEVKPLVAEIQEKVACHTDLPPQEFFELLDRLNKLAECLGKKEAKKSVVM